MKKLCPFRTYIGMVGVTSAPCMGDKCMLWGSKLERCELRRNPPTREEEEQR